MAAAAFFALSIAPIRFTVRGAGSADSQDIPLVRPAPLNGRPCRVTGQNQNPYFATAKCTVRLACSLPDVMVKVASAGPTTAPYFGANVRSM
jgi:hypothetical protein